MRALPLVLAVVLMAASPEADRSRLDRELDGKVGSLKAKALKRIEDKLGLTSPVPEKLVLVFADLPEAKAKERRIDASDLKEDGGIFTVTLHREFARAGVADLEGEATYQLARAVWRQVYPQRDKVAAWLLHGMALHASGMGDDRVLFIIADNEDKTTEIVDGWEEDNKHNERDQADDILAFRYIEEKFKAEGLKVFLKKVGEGADPVGLLGADVPGGFKLLEKEWSSRGKEEIEKLAHKGLEGWKALYKKYQDTPNPDRPDLIDEFHRLISKGEGCFWESSARYYLGRCLFEAGKEDKAILEFQKVLGPLARRSDPRILDMAKFHLGRLYLERRKNGAAEEAFGLYIRDFTFGKYQSEARLELAQMHLEERKPKEARPLLEWIMAHEPKSDTAEKAAKLLKELDSK
ncbi:MAG: tol-pal system YbgF family protein [Planctomycetota bacterium]